MFHYAEMHMGRKGFVPQAFLDIDKHLKEIRKKRKFRLHRQKA